MMNRFDISSKQLFRNAFKSIVLALFIAAFHSSSVAQEKEELLFVREGYTFPYNPNQANRSWDLPKMLREISGLSYIEENKLACIQDEKGNIYVFNIPGGEVERKIDFGKDGDYEGIEVLGKDAWVLRSNGRLNEIRNYANEELQLNTEYDSRLSGKNDAEGLAWDPFNKHLLIACKGHPFVDEKTGREFKAVYRFDLQSRELDLKPLFLIEMDSIKYYKEYNTMTRLGVELLAYIDQSKGDVSFQPSGIAVHPFTGNIYITAAVGNLLLVCEPAGNILAMVKLKSKHHPQPEGICFAPDGTLYIANEGKDRNGTILEFRMKHNNLGE